jgi:hypothetical protein
VGDEDGVFAFCFGDPALAPAGYKGVPLLTNYPQNLSARLDPIKVEYELSGFTFSLAAETPWLSLFMRRIHFAEGALVTALDADDTTVEIAYTGAFNAGEFVYLGRETIHLGTLSSSTSYVDPVTDQTVSYDVFTGCARGALGSVAGPHYVSESDDNRVYAFPEMSGRLVEFWELSGDDEAPGVSWRGVLSDVRLEDEDESTMLVDTTDLLSLLTSRRLNRTPYSASTVEDVVGFSDADYPRWLWFASKLDPDTTAARVRYGKTGRAQGSTTRLALQVGSALVPGRIVEQQGASDADSWWGYGTLADLGLRSYTQLGSDLDGDQEGRWVRARAGAKIYEVLCFGQDFVDPYGVYYGCGRNTSDKHHPLHLLLLVLLSTGTGDNHASWDTLGAEWGLGVPSQLVDVAAFEAEIARTPELKLDRLQLGWDGREWVMRDLLDKALRPLGYYLSRDGSGRITISRVQPLSTINAVEVSWTDVVEMSERLERRMESASQKIRATFGLPWGEQSTISFENRGKQARLWWPESDDVGADFDLSAFGEPDNFGKSAVSVYLASVLQQMWRPIPIQRLSIKGKASDALWPGKQILLFEVDGPLNSDGSRGVLVDKDGARTVENLLGLVVEAEYSAQDGTWTLGLWLQNEPLRGGNAVAIPPASEVTAYNGGTGALTVQRVQQNVDLASYIVVGTQFMLCNKYLAPRAWAAPVTYMTVAAVTLGVSTLTLLFDEGLSTASPVAGDVIRWAEYGANSDQTQWLYGASDVPRLDTTDPPKWYV